MHVLLRSNDSSAHVRINMHTLKWCLNGPIKLNGWRPISVCYYTHSGVCHNTPFLTMIYSYIYKE